MVRRTSSTAQVAIPQGRTNVKAGSSRLRSTLVSAADNARKTDPQLARSYAVQMARSEADPSVAEPAWSSLRRELVHRYRFATRAEARRAIFAWINRYNSGRRHSSLGYIAPITWEQQYSQPKANTAA